MFIPETIIQQNVFADSKFFLIKILIKIQNEMKYLSSLSDD